MRKILTAALFALAIGECSGQALKSGFDHLRNNRLDDAAKVFSKALSKGTESLAANYGMGCLFCNPDYSGYNATKGFRMLRNSHDRYQATSPKTKEVCKKVYGFDKGDIYAAMNKAAGVEWANVSQKNTFEYYQWFIETFDGADSLTHLALCNKGELAWENTKKANTMQAYSDFADSYPGTPHEKEASDLAKKLWQKMCRDAYDEGELSAMDAFAAQYPKYPYYTNKEKEEYKLAQEGFKLRLNLSYSTDYEPYYKAYIDKAAPNQLAYEALKRIMYPYLEMGMYDEAAALISSYKAKFPNRASDIEKTAAMLREPGDKYKSTPLPQTINTEHMEYAPVITPDGNTLYFCANGRADNVGNEDIFVSRKVGGKWEQAKGFNQFNTALGNEAPLAVSPDGNMLLIYKDSNIYFTERKGTGWTPLKKMPGLNTGNSWEGDASFSPDGNAIFFISDRRGNVGNYHPHEKYFHGSYHGNSDIYVSTRNVDDGSWNDPINIGTTINTPFTERSPWLASDMKTLYFSSDGHYGIGMLDAFKSTRLNDSSWTEWSEPVNLGKEINTAHDDYNYLIATDGKSAMFTKMTSSNVDICTVDLPVKMRPEAIGIIFGKVTDNNGNQLAANIKWEDLQSGKTLGNLRCNPANGTYFVTLPAGRNYGYYVELDNYYPVSGNINTENMKTGMRLERNIVMNSINDILDGKVSIILENIFFETNKYELKQESKPELMRLARFIDDNPEARLEISGHTDNSGQAEANKTLSQRRAESVREFLISLGCDESQLISKGYGADKPIDTNATEAGKARNRRVEFRILGN